MPFFITCDNKGCYQTSEALLNDENEVVCKECHGVIKNVTSFTKQSLKNIGQIVKKKDIEPYSTMCNSCKRMTVPIKDEKNKNAPFRCKHCKENLELSPIFQKAILNSASKNA